MKVFKADTGYWADGKVWVIEGQSKRLLDKRLDIVNHSPTGFAWGYEGSGPAQLSFALLAELIGPSQTKADPALYHQLKHDMISRLDKDKGWRITEKEIRDWLFAALAARNEQRWLKAYRDGTYIEKKE